MCQDPFCYENNYLEFMIADAAKNYNIYLITMDKSIQFWWIINQGVSDMSGLLGVPYTWDAPQKRNVEEQIAIIANATRNGADAIMLAAIDPVKEAAAVADAKSHGVKIIYVDSPATEPGIVTLATDHYDAGVAAGESMIIALNERGIKSGSIGIINISLTSATTMKREKGFQKIIKENGHFRLLATKYTYNNEVLAQWAARSFLNDNPDLVGLFGTDESSTIGIAKAVKNLHANIVGIGFDLPEDKKSYINQGYLTAVMEQNAYTIGYLGMAETIAALNNYNTGPDFLDTGISIQKKYWR